MCWLARCLFVSVRRGSKHASEWFGFVCLCYQVYVNSYLFFFVSGPRGSSHPQIVRHGPSYTTCTEGDDGEGNGLTELACRSHHVTTWKMFSMNKIRGKDPRRCRRRRQHHCCSPRTMGNIWLGDMPSGFIGSYRAMFLPTLALSYQGSTISYMWGLQDRHHWALAVSCPKGNAINFILYIYTHTGPCTIRYIIPGIGGQY